MRIVFFGTSEFAVPALKALIGSLHKVPVVVTQPDRRAGRSLKMSPPPIKVLAETHGIPVYQPQDISSAEAIDYLKNLDADLFVVISFGKILKKEIISIPKIYSINIHGSLLPKYRGAAPTNWAIIEGERITGVTVIRMNERMDEGDIILKKEIPIEEEDTNITLTEKLSDTSALALLEAIDLIASKKEKFEKQDSEKATYAPKLKKEDGVIDWTLPAVKIRDRVRGLIPWPGAYTYYRGKILKILHAELFNDAQDNNADTGEVLAVIKNKGIIVNTGAGTLAIKNLQLEGGRILDSDSFVRGHRIEAGYVFPSKL
ncbi:MAG: methionyl-tRNA formyltransferase [Candidatus Omnitrophica bacterium]|nr:methionyl-tRNA formyltransferase [Candidatus Omnitrophota bacterium]MCM8790553.1 methionyl-tRNA formyltransferase [Candidatus Omnitrophota bacterium]